MADAVENGYTADDIQVLKGLEAVQNVRRCTLAIRALMVCTI